MMSGLSIITRTESEEKFVDETDGTREESSDERIDFESSEETESPQNCHNDDHHHDDCSVGLGMSSQSLMCRHRHEAMTMDGDGGKGKEGTMRGVGSNFPFRVKRKLRRKKKTKKVSTNSFHSNGYGDDGSESAEENNVANNVSSSTTAAASCQQQPPSPSTSTTTKKSIIVSDYFGTASAAQDHHHHHDDDDDAVGTISSQNSISCPPQSSHIISHHDEQETFIDRTTAAANSPPTSQRRQIIAALSANLGSMALGATLAWTATALPDLRDGEKLWKITPLEESWIGSSMTLGAIFGCPVAGFGMKFGRRISMLLLILPFLTGWLSILLAMNLEMIYVGRFFIGLSCGVVSLVVPVYIVETSDTNIRGACTSGFDTFITIGILYIFLLGSYTSWRIQALLCGLIPVAFFISMLFMPESPRYLVERGREEEAVEAIAWLKNSRRQNQKQKQQQQVLEELVEIKRSIAESKGAKGTWRDLFTLPVIKPTTICLDLMFFQQLSGIDPVTFYTVDIFRSSGSKIDDHLSVNIVGVAQIATTVVAALLVDRSGRRVLLLLSGIFMVLSLGSLGLFFYLKELNGGIPPQNLGWLPLSSLLVYVIAFSIGFGPLPWLLLGELIPSHVIGLAACLVTMSRWLLGFGVTLMDLIWLIGHHGAYWFFGSICLIGTLYVYIWVPETKNKTLYEIFLHFNPHLVDTSLLPTA